MHDLAVDNLVKRLEMGNVERPYRFHGHRERAIRDAFPLRLTYPLPRCTECAKHLCSIEPLSLTVIAETHGVILQDGTESCSSSSCRVSIPA